MRAARPVGRRGPQRSSASIVFGVDDETMESVVLDLLRARGLSLGLAESVTGGLVAGRLTGVPGASDVFRGSIVSYASEVKFDLLGVPEGPVVSEAAARQMAGGAQRVLGADVGLALTGVAGPAEQDGMPVGHAVRRPGDRRRRRCDPHACGCPASASRCAR